MADREVDPFRFGEPIYVLCEGSADARLVTRLLKREDLEGFSVNFAKGYQRFVAHVQALTASSDWRKVKRLLIIGDNDTKPAQRWQNAKDALTDEGLRAPDQHAEIVNGTHDGPSTGIFMMPSADKHGALETLLVQAILQKHEGLAECLQQLDECPASYCDGWDAGEARQDAVSDRRSHHVQGRPECGRRTHLVQEAQPGAGCESGLR